MDLQRLEWIGHDQAEDCNLCVEKVVLSHKSKGQEPGLHCRHKRSGMDKKGKKERENRSENWCENCCVFWKVPGQKPDLENELEVGSWTWVSDVDTARIDIFNCCF